jgi:hypothetical protein
MSRSFLNIIKKLSNYPNCLQKKEIMKTQHLAVSLEVSEPGSVVLYAAYC